MKEKKKEVNEWKESVAKSKKYAMKQKKEKYGQIYI